MTNCPNLKAMYNYKYTKEKNIKLNNSNKPDWYSDIVKAMASADLKRCFKTCNRSRFITGRNKKYCKRILRTKEVK